MHLGRTPAVRDAIRPAGRAHRRPSGKALRRVLVLVGATVGLVTLALVGVVGWIGSERAIHPAPQVEKHHLADYAFAATTEMVRFPSQDGTPLVGWFVPGGTAPAATVILLHGFGASRAQLLPHAAYLHRAGYNVLLFDFRNRGESGGDAVTMGVREPLDVRGAVRYALSRPDVDPARIAVQGIGLGAVAGIIAMGEEPRIAAVVAEGAFTDLDAAIDSMFHAYIGLPSFPFAPVTVFIVERRLGAQTSAVRPIDVIGRIGARAAFLIDAREDAENPPDSGRRLYDAASGPRELWITDNSGHAVGYDPHPEEYAARVLAFYAAHLRGGTPPR